MYRSAPLRTLQILFLICFGFQVYCWGWRWQGGTGNLLPRAVNLSYRTGAMNEGLETCRSRVRSQMMTEANNDNVMTMPRLKNQHLDSNSGHPHNQASNVPLCYADLLILNRTEWIFILNGWGRGIKTVYTQVRTRDTHITRPEYFIE